MRGFHFVLVSSWVLAGTAMIECSSDKVTCDDAGSCTDGGVPSVSGGGCDSSKPASQGGCAVDDSDGFFVSITGADTNAGTKVAPFKTIAAGITAASASAKQPNVYVCGGNYPENLLIKNAPAGVALHGGFDCTSWAQANGLTQVAPAWIANATQPQYVLLVDAAAALVEGMTLIAPNAGDPGASSVAVFVNGSPGMTFRRATVLAGSGADGATAPAPPAVLPAAANGNNGSFFSLAPMKVCPCGSSDSSIGGQGGGEDAGSGPILVPEAGAPIVGGDTSKGQPGVQGGQPQCNGGDGANGLNGQSGLSANVNGVLTANGWSSNGGSVGVAGGTAQGGAGGWYGVGGANGCGGSGACGGCGGSGGLPGGGGGGSISVGAISSTLRVQASTIRAGKAGNGGAGAAGQAGQPGGTGGLGGCNGGNGGKGGDGGPGGGGAGGVSIAIAASATSPDIDQQSSILAGTAGQGGAPGAGAQTKGIDGIAATVHAF